MIQKHEGSAQSTPEYPRNRAPESAYAATHPTPHHRRKHTPPTCDCLHTARHLCRTRAKHQRIAAKAHTPPTFVNSMPLLHARRTFSAPARRDGRASEAPAIHSLPARTLRLYYSAFCVQMRDIILPRGALFHHFLNVYTKGRPAAAKDTPPGDRPRAFIQFYR